MSIINTQLLTPYNIVLIAVIACVTAYAIDGVHKAINAPTV